MATDDPFEGILTFVEEAGIAYMLVGSYASSYYGPARATQDYDIVISSTEAQVRDFVGRLPNDRYYVNLNTALDALARNSMFNVLDLRSGWRFDFIFCRSRPFSQSEFSRRTRQEVQGVSTYIASAEDVIISKLEWAHRSGSQRQLEDVVRILQTRWVQLDQEYLAKWIADLRLTSEWSDARKLAGIIQ